jgi:hypothetical protein
MHSLRLLLVLAGIVLLAGAAQGQVATAIVVEGQPVPGNDAYLVDSISLPAVNHAGGWAFNLNSVMDAETIALAYGTLDGIAAADILRTETTVGDYEQNSWESFCGLGGNGLAYSPSCTRLSDGQTGLDSVWYEDTVVAIEEEVYPYAEGYWWSFGSRPGATQDGIPFFVGGITDSQGGSTQKRGLFYGPDATPLIIGGDMIDGLPDPVVDGSGAVSFDYRFSAYGTHYLAEVATETGSSTNDNNMVSDGAVVLVDGQPVSEGSPLPAAAGGLPGENWDNFDYTAITEDGHWLLTGDTDGDTATDEFLMIDGMIILREGDLVDGMPLDGGIERAYMNEQGDWACVWDVVTAEGAKEALLLNGEIVLMVGMPVDVDGDGNPDPDAVVTDFTGIAALAVADRDDLGRALVYFTADIEVGDPITGGGGLELPADEAAGLDEAYSEAPGTRAEVEMGLVLVPEGSVPVYLAEFDAVDQGGRIELRWRIHGQGMANQFAVRARQGDELRMLTAQGDGPGRFRAEDRPAAGEVTYELLHEVDGDWELLAEKTLTPDLMAGVRLIGAQPNPFNPQTKVMLSLGREQHVRVTIHDAVGRQVAVLHDGLLAAGEHGLPWSGERVASGVYFARLLADEGVAQAKLLLVK